MSTVTNELKHGVLKFILLLIIITIFVSVSTRYYFYFLFYLQFVSFLIFASKSVRKDCMILFMQFLSQSSAERLHRTGLDVIHVVVSEPRYIVLSCNGPKRRPRSMSLTGIYLLATERRSLMLQGFGVAEGIRSDIPPRMNGGEWSF